MCARLAVYAAALLVVGHSAVAQTKVAVVNLQRAVFESAEIKKANDQMQATFKPRQERIDQLQKEIAAISEQLQKSGGKLSPQAESDLTSQGTKKQRDLQRLVDDLNADSQNYRNDALTKSSNKMTEVVKKLAEEKGYDLVVEASSALYFKTALDITNDAIAAFDKAYPAK